MNEWTATASPSIDGPIGTVTRSRSPRRSEQRNPQDLSGEDAVGVHGLAAVGLEEVAAPGVLSLLTGDGREGVAGDDLVQAPALQPGEQRDRDLVQVRPGWV